MQVDGIQVVYFTILVSVCAQSGSGLPMLQVGVGASRRVGVIGCDVFNEVLAENRLAFRRQGRRKSIPDLSHHINIPQATCWSIPAGAVGIWVYFEGRQNLDSPHWR